MNTIFFKKQIKRLVGQRNVFLLLTLAQSLAIVTLTFALKSREEKVVLIPPSGPSYWVEGSKVSPSYLETMGVFLSDLLLNRSPSDADWRNEVFLRYVDPSSYHQIKRSLSSETQGMKHDDTTLVFHPNQTSTNLETLTYTLEGQQIVYITPKQSSPSCGQSLRRRYTLGFRCQNGKLHLISLKQETLNG